MVSNAEIIKKNGAKVKMNLYCTNLYTKEDELEYK